MIPKSAATAASVAPPTSSVVLMPGIPAPAAAAVVSAPNLSTLTPHPPAVSSAVSAGPAVAASVPHAAPNPPPLLPAPVAAVATSAPSPSFVPEIRSMMHAFGDSPRPSAEAAAVLEDAVREQMRDVLVAAAAAAARRTEAGGAEAGGGEGGSAPNMVMVSLEDLVFLMRRNPVKVQRLMR